MFTEEQIKKAAEGSNHMEEEHEVPIGHRYCIRCGGEYGVDYFEL